MTERILRQIKTRYKTWDRGKGKTGDLFIDLMSDDATFSSIGGGGDAMQFTRTHRTREKIRAYFEGLALDWQMIFYNVRMFLVSGHTIAVICECAWKNRHTGKTVHSPKLDVIRVKDGRMHDFFEYFDTHQAYAACLPGGEADARRPKPLYRWGAARTVAGATAATAANVKMLRKLYARWHATRGSSGSARAFVNILAANVIWGSLGAGTRPIAFTQTRMTRDEVGLYFRELASAYDMNFYDVGEYIAAGPFVLVLAQVSFTSRKTGRIFVSPKADLWRFARGKATEFYEYYDTAKAIAAAG
ncbi:MAG: nuclear transport factor 2 family protein [Parvibaculaceae bacterium]